MGVWVWVFDWSFCRNCNYKDLDLDAASQLNGYNKGLLNPSSGFDSSWSHLLRARGSIPFVKIITSSLESAKMKCSQCKKKIKTKESYKCRICYEYYCSDCSLEHFGLKKKEDRIVHKSIIKSFFWNLHKKFWQKD